MENEKNKPRIAVARKIARNLLDEIGIEFAPVLIRDILMHLKIHRRIRIEFYECDLGNGQRGVQITDLRAENDLIIAIHKQQHEHSKRFTVCHELGHYFLNHTEYRHKHSLDIFDEGVGDPLEIEANQFAAELLIPTHILKKDFKNGVKDIQTLATKYRVSTLAMGWKVAKTAGLLTKI